MDVATEECKECGPAVMSVSDRNPFIIKGGSGKSNIHVYVDEYGWVNVSIPCRNKTMAGPLDRILPMIVREL